MTRWASHQRYLIYHIFSRQVVDRCTLLAVREALSSMNFRTNVLIADLLDSAFRLYHAHFFALWSVTLRILDWYGRGEVRGGFITQLGSKRREA